jgi:hypothetical protein
LAQSLSKDSGSPRGGESEECLARHHKNPKPDSLALTLPTRFIDVEDFFPRKSLLDFLTAGFNCLGDFLVKIAYRTNRDVDTKQCLSDFLTASSGHPVQGGKIGQSGGKSGAETGSGMGWNFCPCSSPTRAFHTPQFVFRDHWFDFGNISNLATKVVPKNPAGPRFNGSVAGFTRLREYLFNMIDFFDGNQLSFCSLVSRLSPRIAFPGFLRPLGLGFLSRAIRRRRLGRIGRISCEKNYLPFKFSNSGLENFHRLTQLNDEINRCFRISIHKVSGFFPCHGGSSILNLTFCQ